MPSPSTTESGAGKPSPPTDHRSRGIPQATAFSGACARSNQGVLVPTSRGASFLAGAPGASCRPAGRAPPTHRSPARPGPGLPGPALAPEAHGHRRRLRNRRSKPADHRASGQAITPGPRPRASIPARRERAAPAAGRGWCFSFLLAQDPPDPVRTVIPVDQHPARPAHTAEHSGQRKCGDLPRLLAHRRRSPTSRKRR